MGETIPYAVLLLEGLSATTVNVKLPSAECQLL